MIQMFHKKQRTTTTSAISSSVFMLSVIWAACSKMGDSLFCYANKLSVKNIIATVNGHAKLHNSCINKSGHLEEMPQSLERDSSVMMNIDYGYVEMVSDKEQETGVLIEMRNAGHHHDKVPRGI